MKPTWQRNPNIYMTQDAIKTRKQVKRTAMLVSRVASESIRNMNKTEDLNKTEKKKYVK